MGNTYHIRRTQFFDMIPKANRDGATILDCAMPFYDDETANMATQSGYEYVPVDISPRDGRIKKEDIFKLSFGDKTFDAILCSHTLEHVVDYHSAIRELLRVLKDDGHIYFRVPCDSTSEYNERIYWPPEKRNADHKWILSSKQVEHDIQLLTNIIKKDWYGNNPKDGEMSWLCVKKNS